ncbi:MAG: ADOP family duplicated permease [Longimicrobiales bacterium]
MDQLIQDLRHSVRLLTRQWGFTLAAVITIALGAGANTTVFSLVNAVLLRPLPIGDPAGAVRVYGTNGRDRFDNFSLAEFQALRARTRSLTELAAFDEVSAILQHEGKAERIVGQIVSANFFSALALQPLAGRFFAPSDENVGAPPVIVISHALWQREFQDRTPGESVGRQPAHAGNPVGRTVLLNGHGFTVVGVAPEHFRGTFRGADYVFWVALGTQPLLTRALPQSPMSAMNNATVWLNGMGRLAPRTSIAQAQSELTGLRVALNQELGLRQDSPGAEVFHTTGLPDGRRGAIRAFMGVLTAISVLVLIIACVNLAGMLVARGLARGKEIALRVALGASRARLLSQLLLETGLLLSLGAAAGALLATWTANPLLAFLPSTDVPIVLDLSLDLRVLVYTFGTTLGFGLLLGVLPILQISRPDLIHALRTATHTITGGRMRLRRVLVRAQIATSLVLVIVTGLFARALLRAERIDPGFQPEGVIAAAIDVGPNAAQAPQGLQLYQRLEDALRRRPDVEAVSFAAIVPLSQFNRGGTIRIAGQEVVPGDPDLQVSVNAIGPEYFRLMRIPLLRGRQFTLTDRADSRSVAIINRAMAQRYWPGADAVGHSFTDALSGTDVTVVGVVADSRFRSLAEPARPFVYYPLSQRYDAQAFVHVRTTNAAGVLRELPALVRGLDPLAAVFDAATLKRHIGFALVPQRIAAAVASAFSALGLLLAGLGLYAVVTFWVLQRRHELAIRSALGASPRQLLRMVGGEGIRMIGGGVVIGLLAALALTHLLRSFLFGVSPFDPIALLGAVAVLALVLLVACIAPARRALRLEPMKVLRD